MNILFWESNLKCKISLLLTIIFCFSFNLSNRYTLLLALKLLYVNHLNKLPFIISINIHTFLNIGKKNREFMIRCEVIVIIYFELTKVIISQLLNFANRIMQLFIAEFNNSVRFIPPSYHKFFTISVLDLRSFIASIRPTNFSP